MSRDADPPVARPAAKPWNGDVGAPASLDRPVGMIGPEERRALWWLAREALRDGFIVDAGCFLGASTFCLAAGAAGSPHAAGRRGPIVHAFDRFAADDDYVARTISRELRPIAPGESFLDIFREQVAPYASIIEAIPGDMLQATWDRGTIDLLFIDVAKNDALNAHVVGTFFPHLVPGRSIVVQQDFHHCWHPAIHVAMEYLADEFELVDELVEHQSRVWRLARPIPAEKIRRLSGRELGAAERLGLLDRLVERSSPRCRPMMELVRARQRFCDGDLDGAVADLGSLRARFDFSTVRALWASQAVKVESQVARRRAAAAVRPRPGSGSGPGVPAEGRMPDFLVLGAQKAGTSWLHRNITDHPEIWVPPIKELHYFDQRFAPSQDGWEGSHRLRKVEEVRPYCETLASSQDRQASLAKALALCGSRELDDATYRAIFACAAPDQVCGEICPGYDLLPDEAIRHITESQPSLRVFLIVRDPVERALSNMKMAHQEGYGDDPELGVPEWGLKVFLKRSDYPAMIRRWQRRLPPGSFHLLSFDDLCEAPGAFLEGFCRTLGVRADERLFPNRHEPVFTGEPKRMHPDVRPRVEAELAFVYEEMHELAPAIARRWEERRRARRRDEPPPATSS